MGRKVTIRITVDEQVYWVWQRIKAELRARTNEEAFIKLLKKHGYLEDISPP